jgi:hypothetical protein
MRSPVRVSYRQTRLGRGAGRGLRIAATLLRGEVAACGGSRTSARRKADESTTHAFELVVPDQRAALRVEAPHFAGIRREQRFAVEVDRDVVVRSQLGAPDLRARTAVERDDDVPDASVDEDLRITGHWYLRDGNVRLLLLAERRRR